MSRLTCCFSVSQVLESDLFLGKTGPRTIFTIELTSGRARDIAGLSMIASESEVLLPPNSRFLVKAKMNVGNELWMIQLEELPPLDPIMKF